MNSLQSCVLIIQIGKLSQCYTSHRFGAKIGALFEAKLLSILRFRGRKWVVSDVRSPSGLRPVCFLS